MSISPKEPLMANMNFDRSNAPVICDFLLHGNRIITPRQPLRCVNFCLETMAK